MTRDTSRYSNNYTDSYENNTPGPEHDREPLAALLARRYDFSWLQRDDFPDRLYRGRNLMHRIVGIAFAGAFDLGWSDPDAPFQGITLHTRPVRILINPEPVLAHRGEDGVPRLLDALHGVALHEGGHAAHTPREWGRRREQIRQEHRKKAGYLLPESLLTPVANWAEDGYVERMVSQRFPGFMTYFTHARSFFLPDERCGELLQEAEHLLARFESDPASHRGDADLLVAVVNLLSVLVNRPGLVDDAARERFAPLIEIAGAIRAAGEYISLKLRLEAAMAAADRLFRFLGPLVDPTLSAYSGRDEAVGSGGDPFRDPARAEAVARVLDVALPRNRITILRDGTDPVSCDPSETTISAADAAALRALEAGRAEFLQIDRVVVRENAAEHRGKTVRVVDSARETLYGASTYPLDTLAEQLLASHRHVAEEMRRKLWFRDAPLEFLDYRQRSGELDEEDLVLVGMKERDVYVQRDYVEARRLDLTLLIDESGSMQTGGRWKLAAAAALCIEFAVRPLRSVRLRVYGFTSDCFAQGETLVYRHYDSADARLRRPQALGWCYPKHNNADGIALAAVRCLLCRDRSRDVLPCLLMMSDGLPQAFQYGGQAAEAHVRREVQETLKTGIQFAHLQIGDTPDTRLESMYGKRWRRVTRADQIPAELAALVMRWLDPVEMRLT